MSHHDGFLQDILAHPDDDAPRLIYADWLDDQGDLDRAEFIRVQCRLAVIDPRAPERPLLEGRQLQLLRRHRKEWAGPLRSWARQWHFHRGFVECVRLPTAAFLEHAAELFACAPVRTVHFVGLAEQAAELARCPFLQRLSGIGLTDPRFVVGQAQSCRSRRYRGGEAVNPLAAQVLDALLSRLSGERLQSLELAGCFLGSAGIRVLARAELPGLRDLDLCNNDLTAEDVLLLAEAPSPRSLRRLRLQSCYNAGLVDAVTRLLPSLELLDLGSCALLEDRDLPPLVAASAPRLRVLLLERNFVGSEGAEMLRRAPFFRQLEVLDLSSCSVDGTEVDGNPLYELLTGPAVSGLTHLSLNNNPLGVEGARLLAAAVPLKHLVRLELAGSRYREGNVPTGQLILGRVQDAIEDAGVEALAGAAHLVCLSALHLRRNAVTSRGLHALLQSPLLPQLFWLDLRDNELGSDGARLLLHHGPWPRLAWLDLRDSGIGAADKRRLRHRFGFAVRL